MGAVIFDWTMIYILIGPHTLFEQVPPDNYRGAPAFLSVYSQLQCFWQCPYDNHWLCQFDMSRHDFVAPRFHSFMPSFNKESQCVAYLYGGAIWLRSAREMTLAARNICEPFRAPCKAPRADVRYKKTNRSATNRAPCKAPKQRSWPLLLAPGWTYLHNL